MATNLWAPFQVQLDASGNGTEEVGTPALGFNWQGFVTFGSAQAGQSFTVSVSGQVVAYGGRQSGAFAAGSGQTVTVTVTGGPASSTVNGVVQGVINEGNAASASLPTSGSLIEVSGGTVNILGGSITIQAGQNGVNVSTDAPAVSLGAVEIPSLGNSGSLAVSPSASATGLRLFVVPSGNSTPTVKATGNSGFDYFSYTYAVGSGGPVSFQIPANLDNPVTVAVTGYTNSGSLSAPVVQVQELDGTGVQGVEASPFFPLPVVGTLGASGQSVQTIEEPPSPFYVQTTLSAAGVIGSIPGVAGKSIRIRKLHWLESASVGMQLQDGTGGAVIDQLAAPANQTSPDVDYQGRAITQGNELVFYGLGAATFIVYCSYEQY